MVAYPGSAVIMKVGNGGGPETFASIGGLRLSRLALNNRTADTSNISSGGWRQLLANAGLKSVVLSGSGIFTDAVSEEILRGYAFANSVNNYQFIFANGDYISGLFQITAYERSGLHTGEETYAITLESAGNITFTAA